MIGSFGLWLMAASRQATLDGEGRIVGDGRIVAVDPTHWPGGRLPLRDYLITKENVERGDWTLLLVRSDCRKCAAVLERLRDMPHATAGKRLLIVNLDPADIEGCDDDAAACATLDRQYRWIAPTPSLVHLWEGIVQSVQAP